MTNHLHTIYIQPSATSNACSTTHRSPVFHLMSSTQRWLTRWNARLACPETRTRARSPAHTQSPSPTPPHTQTLQNQSQEQAHAWNAERSELQQQIQCAEQQLKDRQVDFDNLQSSHEVLSPQPTAVRLDVANQLLALLLGRVCLPILTLMGCQGIRLSGGACAACCTTQKWLSFPKTTSLLALPLALNLLSSPLALALKSASF